MCRDPNFSSPEKEDEDDDDFNINNFDFDDDGNVIMDINYDNYDMEMYPSPMYNPMEGPDERWDMEYRHTLFISCFQLFP